MRSRFAILLAIAAVCATTALAGWTSDSLVTGGPGVYRIFLAHNNAHKVVFGTDRVGHLVWQGGPTTDHAFGIWYNRYSPGSGSQPGKWGADFAVVPYSSKKKVAHACPCVALDGDGRTIHVVWSARPPIPAWPDAPDTICYRRCTQDRRGNDKWDATLPLFAAKYVSPPAVACAPNEPNHVLVCWRHLVEIAAGGYSMVTRLREYVNGTWGVVVLLDSSYMGPQQEDAAVAVAPNGDVFVAYPGYVAGTSGTQILVKTRHNGAWGQAVNVTETFSTIGVWNYAIEVDPITGNPHMVLQRSTVVGQDTVRAVYHTYRDVSGAWLTTPEVISDPTHVTFCPTMAFVSDGAAHVVWQDTVPLANGGIMYSYCSSEGGTWSTPEGLTSYRGCPFIAAEEPAHALHVAWCRTAPGNMDPTEIWWKSNYQGGGGSQAEPVMISQSGIELVPNPVKAGRVTVQYSLPNAGSVRATLLDVSGRAVETQEVAATNRSGSFSIDVKRLRAGAYILKLKSDTSSHTKKLVIE